MNSAMVSNIKFGHLNAKASYILSRVHDHEYQKVQRGNPVNAYKNYIIYKNERKIKQKMKNKLVAISQNYETLKSRGS